MVVASLHHFLRGHSRTLVPVAIVVALLVTLYLLGYAVFASDLTTDHSPDGPLVGPFRWLNAVNIG